MRIIQAFVLQYGVSLTSISGILDWILSPKYLRRACPNDTLVLYTDENSVDLLGDLWPYIRDSYDEVYTNLLFKDVAIFSAPKFEAMTRELENFGTDFIMIDNDLYAFPGFSDNIENYCAYFAENNLLPWYDSIVDGRYGELEAPEWLKWTATPYNCATIRLNNKELLTEYIKLFYQIKAEKLTSGGLERAVVKEQWSLGELFNKYKIVPQCLESQNKSLHKGKLKQFAKPSHIICIQEYLASWLAPKAYKVFKQIFSDFKNTKYDINWCLDSFLEPFERTGLLAPVYELANKKRAS